uniref:Uncharacterized protein n=1 Tax=Triticum urartu TaxID=4572 RepID=A0A8R7V3E6_TRIUA
MEERNRTPAPSQSQPAPSALFPFLLPAPARVAATASFGPPIPILRRNNDRRGAEWPAADRRKSERSRGGGRARSGEPVVFSFEIS